MARGIYFHIPFCQQKCTYCDFLSAPADSALIDRYLKALLKESRQRIDVSWRSSDTIFIGGGTPSVLSLRQWAYFLDGLASLIELSSLKEWTVEANPGTVSKELLKLLFAAGVNRLSFGVQSFDQKMLALLGRTHTAKEVVASCQLAKDIGFTNINLDFIYALPQLSLRTWQETLAQAVALQPTHLALYGLVLGENTRLGQWIKKGVLAMPDEDLAVESYLWQQSYLKEAGYRQYEISNYAQANAECLHNCLYWQMEDWLGLGLGAGSHINRTLLRVSENMADYLESIENGKLSLEQENMSLEVAMSEQVIMGLRLNQGVDNERFRRRFHYSLERLWPKTIAKGINDGLLQWQGKFLSLTESGRLLGNLVFERFLMPED